ENFAILPNSLVLLKPGDGDSVAVGDTVRFEWRRVGLNPGVTVYLKRNYPSGQWEILASNVAVDTFAWVASGATSNNARFRVISTVNTALGDSAGPCPIGNPALAITSPTSAQTYVAGGTTTIAWSRSFAPGTVKIELSRDGVNGPWSEIGQSDEAIFNWLVTAPATSDARFRISLVNKTWVQGATAFDNSIVIPDLDLTSPEPGDTIAVGREIVIAWTRTHVSDPIDVMVDRGSPVADAEFLRQDVSGDSIHWTVTPPITPNTRFVLRSSSGVLVEEDGDTVFVMANPLLTLVAPSGGEQWITGQSVNIQWQRAAVSDPAHVELNRNYPSGAWERLASSVSGSQFAWTVSGTATTNARVRAISAIDENLADICDTPLSIIIPALAFAGTLTERVPIGFPTNVTWQSNNLSGTVSLYLSRDNGASYPEVIASGLATTSFAWTPVGATAAQARLKIQSDLQPNVNAVSSAFVLAQPSVQVTYPQNGETLSLGAPHTLSWNRDDHPGSVNVDFSNNYPSGGWTTIAANVNADSLVWTANGVASATARVRVTSSVNGSWSDLGDNNFTLIVPTIDLTSPESGSELVLGDLSVIHWQRIGWSGEVSVALNRVGGSSTVIAPSTTADSIAWICTGAAAPSSWLVVRSAETPSRADSVLVVGPYQPNLQITSHENGARLVNGVAHTLRWSREHLGANVELLLNSGAGFVSVGSSANDSLVFTPSGAETNGASLIARSVSRPDVADTVANLRIVSPHVTLNAPASTEMRLDHHVIFSWTSHELIGDAILELSRHGLTGPWEEIDRGTETSFEWAVSGEASDNVRLRIRSELEPQFADTLDAALSIYRPSLSLAVSPLNPVMYIGEQVSFEVVGDHVSEASLAIVRDGNVETISQLAVPGTLDWTIGGVNASSALFRVWVEGDDELIEESAPFELRVPSLSFSALPADIFVDESVALNWNSDGVDGPYEIVALDESGESVIASGVTESEFEWNVVGERGGLQLIVRAQNAPQFADTSDAITLHVPELLWTYPTESGIDTAGQTIELAWSAIDQAAPVRLEVSFDAENQTWSTVAESVEETTYSYLLPASETASLRFRITSIAHGSVSVTSVARELIAPSLSITNNDDVWYIGEQRWIHWTRHHASGDVSVDVNYGDRAEENWLPLATSLSDSFLWTVDGPESDLAAIRVRLSGNHAVFDTTDIPIAIRAPHIAVIEPNGGEALDPTTLIRIRWSGEGLPAGVSIGLWRGAPVNRLDTLFLSTENDGDEEWVVTGPASDSCYIVITAEGDTSIHDISDASFRITTGSAIDPRDAELPNEIALGAPYPNPFNAQVTIPFALPKDADVKVVVFDLLGREVMTLEEGRRRAGYLHAQWNATNFASGTYFVQMRSEEFTDVRRLILMK
ncbi:T9SS type A sorting domain-containing protein, partial [bacterium]|nr:T9SS type A sorting domain-containing protein [bacterium]